MTIASDRIDRRSFLNRSISCGAHLAAMFAIAPTAMQAAFACSRENEKLFEEDWGWFEKVNDNVWAHIASPFEKKDYTTVCNGGIIAGRDRILVVESYQTTKGAKWVGDCCQRLTGRWPTDIIVTHFHGDHVSGSKGFATSENSPRMWITQKTHDFVKEAQANREPTALLSDLTVIDDSKPTTLDLGDTQVKVTGKVGHTPSDVSIEVVDPSIVFCGDLFWNRLVPNYRDSLPSRWKQSVEQLMRGEETTYIPGHGSLASLQDLRLYVEFLDYMEHAVRTAHSAGHEANDAAHAFTLDEEFADWFIFAESVVPTAFRAWYRELDQNGA